VGSGEGLRPLRVGEVLDAAIKLYRRNAVDLWKIVACVVVPVLLIRTIIVGVTLPSDSFVHNGLLYTPTGQISVPVGAAIAGAVLSVVAALVASGALAISLVDAYVGQPIDWVASIREAGGRQDAAADHRRVGHREDRRDRQHHLDEAKPASRRPGGRHDGRAQASRSPSRCHAGRRAAVSGIDVTAVSASEVATVRDFLARRERLAPDARARVARTLADSLAGRIGGIEPGSLPPEGLLETVVAAKATGPGGAAGADTVPANPDHTAEAELDPLEEVRDLTPPVSTLTISLAPTYRCVYCRSEK
jgi:hypothetical protein